MNALDLLASHFSYSGRGVTYLVVLLCVCVVAQFLGVPFTALDLFNSDKLIESELGSEDFSSLSSLPDAESPRLLHSLTEVRSVHHLPVLTTSLFRPPSV